jgi:hypothetical protein
MFDDRWLFDLLQQRSGMLTDAGVAKELAATLAEHQPDVDGRGIVTRVLLTALDEVWERGWQPADVAHSARKAATAGSVPLAVALMGQHARHTDAASRAPDAWVDQLRELGALSPGALFPGDRTVVAAWHRAERRSPKEAWRVVLLLAGMLHSAARLEVLIPPPSRWGLARSRPDGEPAAGDDRVLRRIRGLLAKAESSEFPEEAESLTAKAQELMTRHSVDAALLGAGSPSAGGMATHRVHVAEPYVRAKMQLLAAVAEANDVQLVWYQSLGIANLVGSRPDLDAVELLFTSLLLQAAQALSAAERAKGARSSSRSFRRSFLLGYAQRIGERLRTAQRRATEEASAEHGVDLLPVLRSRQAAVEERVAELFPRVRSTRSRASVDAGGWYAGQAAAERAAVGRRRSALP